MDGITFSLLSRFLVCRERFRLLVVEGLRPADAFNHRIEYGSMWHVCEETLAKIQCDPTTTNRWKGAVEAALSDYVEKLYHRYPLSREDIEHWAQVCWVQFPIYVDWWARHPDVLDRKPLMQEVAFSIPYVLPSGRAVKLRGKWDSVDVIGKGPGSGIYLQENKTKGEVRQSLIARQLTFDLQTMIYLVALIEAEDCGPILGVRYNVVRRPLSGGGKGDIRRHKPSKSNPRGETKDEFYHRLSGIIADQPGEFFYRWKVEVTPEDVAKFRLQCLNPILEQLCDWWEHVKAAGDQAFLMNYKPALHWRHPFGVYNVLDEGGASDLDEYLASGSEAGLERTTNLFPELT